MEIDKRIDKGFEKVDQWFGSSVGEIERIMRYFSDETMNNAGDGWTAKEISSRSLSERPICHSWPLILEKMVLPGFRYISSKYGYVEISDPAIVGAALVKAAHCYMMDDKNGVVACLTFGQFILPTARGFIPGDRINYAKRFVPDLIVTAGGVSILRGEIGDIGKRLGLLFGEEED